MKKYQIGYLLTWRFVFLTLLTLVSIGSAWSTYGEMETCISDSTCTLRIWKMRLNNIYSLQSVHVHRSTTSLNSYWYNVKNLRVLRLVHLYNFIPTKELYPHNYSRQSVLLSEWVSNFSLLCCVLLFSFISFNVIFLEDFFFQNDYCTDILL